VTDAIVPSAVAICCCLADVGYVILDPTKLEEQVSIINSFMILIFHSKCSYPDMF
jgi:exosome complex component RRP46